MSERTIDTYSGAMQDFGAYMTELGRRSVVEITRKDFTKYRLSLLDRGFRENSVAVYLQAVKRFFAWLEDSQKIFVNPAEGHDAFRKSQCLLPVPTQEEMRVLLQQPDTRTAKGIRDRAILEVAYSTALRRHELAFLQLKSTNLEDRTIRLMGKGAKERVVPLGSQAAEWLRRYAAEVRPQFARDAQPEALWLTVLGRPMSKGAMHAMVIRYRQSGGLSQAVTIHGIRRACATHMLQNGAHPTAIQLLLGHQTLAHLHQYLRIGIPDLKAAHERSRPGQ